MNEINMEERIAIRSSGRTLKKYGSTSNNSKKCETYTKHQVQETDTLQGIALKYGVTTEQIRRANKLWANDSLFLRKSLLIPVVGEPITPTDVVLVESEVAPPLNNNTGEGTSTQRDDYSYNDFLVKIDCAIASTKTQVMVAQDNSEFVDQDSIFWKRKGAVSRLKQQQQSTSNGTELPTVKTQGRKIRNSLQRLEEKQDEMFEL